MNSKLTSVLLIILSAAVIATIGTILYHFIDTTYETETAVFATSEQSQTFQGVYIRDESVLTYNGNGVISYNVSDGGKIGKDEVIAEVYSDNSAIEIKQEVSKLQSELDILKRISNQGVLKLAQPSVLSDQVSQYYDYIAYCRDKGDLVEMKQAKENFRIALSSYQLVVNQGVTGFSDQINSVTEEIETLKAKKQSPKDKIVSPKSAYFVSYADGYETKLTIDSIPDLTVSDIEAVTSNGNLKNGNIVGKTVSSYGWYMVGVIDNSKLDYKEGDVVTLKLSSSSATATATIKDIKASDSLDKSIVILYCDRMTSEFVQNRTERVEMIKGTYKGIKVPRSAIRFKDIEEVSENTITGKKTVTTVNYRGVYVMDGEKVVFKKLDVIYEGDDYVLSKLNSADDYLILYDSIIVEGIDADAE